MGLKITIRSGFMGSGFYTVRCSTSSSTTFNFFLSFVICGEIIHYTTKYRNRIPVEINSGPIQCATRSCTEFPVGSDAPTLNSEMTF